MFRGQVLCQRIEIGLALTIAGKPSVAAPVAAAPRQSEFARDVADCSFVVSSV